MEIYLKELVITELIEITSQCWPSCMHINNISIVKKSFPNFNSSQFLKGEPSKLQEPFVYYI